VLIDNGLGDRLIEDVLLVANGRVRFSLNTYAALGSALQPTATINHAEAEVEAGELRLARSMAERGTA